MISLPSNFVTIEWLIPTFNEQLSYLQTSWDKLAQDTTADAWPDFADMTARYHELSGALQMAELPAFVPLTQTLELLSQQLISDRDTRNAAQHSGAFANALLQGELNHYAVTGDIRQQFLVQCTQKVLRALPASVIPAYSHLNSEFAADTLFATPWPIPEASSQPLMANQYALLLKAWRQSVRQLLLVNSNDAQYLAPLQKISHYLWAASSSQVLRTLWYLSKIWLENLGHNEHPKPAQYASLLASLDQVLQVLSQLSTEVDSDLIDSQMLNEVLQGTTVEGVVADICINLSALAHNDAAANVVLNALNTDTEGAQRFLPRILSRLATLNFDAQKPLSIVPALSNIRRQLRQRGWLLYEQDVDKIITDIKRLPHAADQSGQLQKQIKQQLQSLNSAITNAHETIVNKIGQAAVFTFSPTANHATFDADADADADAEQAAELAYQAYPDTVRQLRIAVESIKADFNSYLQQRQVESLPSEAKFVEIQQAFTAIHLHDVATVSSQIGELFSRLKAADLATLAWPLVKAIAEILASLELFLDYLAQQVFDQAMLEQLQTHLPVANDLLNKVIADPDAADLNAASTYSSESRVADNVTRYDDSGEIAAIAVEQSANTLEIVPAVGVTEAFIEDDLTASVNASAPSAPLESEALKAARATLKEDNFDMDEEIREIFVEEAEEVLEQLDQYLPIWQQAPQDLTPLSEIRRGFHTLKGSGRMVGAFNTGEMAWAVEDMLNRVLDKTVPVTDELIRFIRDTKDLIPILVEDFAHLREPSIDPAITVLKAKNLLAGRPIHEGLVAAAASEQSAAQQDLEPLATLTPTASAEEEPEVKIGDAVVGNEDALTATEAELPEVLVPFLTAVMPSDSEDTDPEIQEIFIEEADEVLTLIMPKFAEYHTALMALEAEMKLPSTAEAALLEVRRGFHTLKGSGRMAGANHSAELAWAIENMLNRILEHTLSPSADMMALVEDVLSAYPALLAIFESGNNNYPEQIALWTACANAYSNGLGDAFSYAIVREYNADALEPLAPLLDNNELLTELDSAENKAEAVQADSLEVLHRINEQLEASPVFVQPQDEEEQAFFDIFIEEAQERLQTIKSFVTAHSHDSEVMVADDIVRAFHTLKGAAGSQCLSTISDISSTIEHSLEQLQNHDAAMGPKHLQALAQSVELIEGYLEVYKQDHLQGKAETATVSQQQHDADSEPTDLKSLKAILGDSEAAQHSDNEVTVAYLLQDNIDALLDAEWELESHLSEQDSAQVSAYAQTMIQQIHILKKSAANLPKFQKVLNALLGVYECLQADPELAWQDAVVNALLAGHGELTGLFDALAGSISLKVDDEVLTALMAIVSQSAARTPVPMDNDTTIAREDNAPAAPAVSNDNALAELSTNVSATASEQLDLEPIETDAELLEIFLEEAQELDADINHIFATWRDDPNDMEALKALQRHLHTIKGGARMAGIKSLGDLTHEAETVYEYFVGDKLTPSLGWVSVMQGIQDTMSAQIDYLVQHQQSFYATSLVEALQRFIATGIVPDDTRVSLPILKTAKLQEVKHEETSVEDLVAESNSRPDITDTTYNSEISDRAYLEMVAQSWEGEQPDPDILAVVLEESQELLGNVRDNMQIFRSNSGDTVALEALQRDLHTIKGGARMVAANGMANLAHQMETTFEGLASRRRPATKKVTQLLVACQNWLTDAIFILSHGIDAPAPNQLITALKAFNNDPDSLVTFTADSLRAQIKAIADYEEVMQAALSERDISKMPAMTGGFEDNDTATDVSNEMIRIPASLIERMINLSGESSINRARIDMGMSSLSNSIEEMGITVQRLSDQLRRMDIELEVQILSQIDEEEILDNADFDPLEMDQYSALNQLSKSLSESASDLVDIKATLLEKTRDSEGLLLQLSRTQAELQNGLMDSRMVPFSRLLPRLQRIVRQTAGELNKAVELEVINADDEIDRTILERITSPLEHMLRNAVDHGIEMPDSRIAVGKPRNGKIQLEVVREGSEIVIHLTDDGSGIDIEAVRAKAISQGLIDPDNTSLTDLDVMQYIFNAGLTTTKKVTQISGRGVGMDVVRSEIRQLGGVVAVESVEGGGSRFTIRVPLTVAVSDALVVRAADRYYAIPLVQIERVVRVSPEELYTYYQSNAPTLEIENTDYRVRYLNEILTGHALNDMVVSSNSSLPVIIIKSQTGQSIAMQVDEIAGSRIEVVVKPLGRQLAHVRGISAATIMGDGSVMLILDLIALMHTVATKPTVSSPVRAKDADQPTAIDTQTTVLVVDDSVTVRKVTSRFLERQGMRAIVAKDGIDAIEILQELTPDIILLDIEMPRMDGFEVATQVRHQRRLKDIPIIMITSRTGEKHRERAMEIGVNDYMGKPFQEDELMIRIEELLEEQALLNSENNGADTSTDKLQQALSSNPSLTYQGGQDDDN
ncbi:Hpt domain-containing protein [Psychrobacter arenosus]|uniref:Hpt domain-containing protein n=1 Tax=Psychrobacter arenosus TaxID=256326 RepID=UPI001918306F|nr:Hpt domain-containing protein [Psychrobacter arenosus]